MNVHSIMYDAFFDYYLHGYIFHLFYVMQFSVALTHSLTSRPFSMRVGDSRRPLRYLFFLNCARSCDIFFSWMYLQPVHSSMSCIHRLLGLPWCRSPSMISSTVSANCPALPRVIWPKYCSFSFATLPINSLSRPNSVNIVNIGSVFEKNSDSVRNEFGSVRFKKRSLVQIL